MKLSKKQQQFIDSDEKRLLVGSRRSGKTTCAAHIAKKTGYPLIVNTHRMRKEVENRFPNITVISAGSKRTIPNNVIVDEIQFLEKFYSKDKNVVAATMTPKKPSDLPRNFDEYHILGLIDNPAYNPENKGFDHKELEVFESFSSGEETVLYDYKNFYHANGSVIEKLQAENFIQAAAIAEIR